MRILVFLACCFVAISCKPWHKHVLFIGDSLTNFPDHCSLPTSWLALQLNEVVAYDEGQFGTEAHQWLTDGRWRPMVTERVVDTVVIALGTNDISHGRFFGSVVDDLQQLRSQIAATPDVRGKPPRVYVATVPPQYNPPGTRPDGTFHPPYDATTYAERTAALNTMLRMLTPVGALFDFDSWMPSAWSADVMWAPWDGIHVGCGGQTGRAAAIQAVFDEER